MKWRVLPGLEPERMKASLLDLLGWRVFNEFHPCVPLVCTSNIFQLNPQELRILLLGSGTLGCGVARALMGWGCRRTLGCCLPFSDFIFEVFEDSHVTDVGPIAL